MTKIQMEFWGDIGSRLRFKYTAAGVALVKFGIKHRYRFRGEWREKWYSLAAWEELAEYIAQHYSMGSTIHILKAVPCGGTFLKRDGQRIETIEWKILEIEDPHDHKAGIAWEKEATQLTEFVDETDEAEEEA